VRIFSGKRIWQIDFSQEFHGKNIVSGLFFELRRRKFDVVLDFETWPRLIPIISYLSGAGIRVGFRVPGQMRHYLFTRPVEHVKRRHELKCFADIVGTLGAELKSVKFDIKVGMNETERIEGMIDSEVSRNLSFSPPVSRLLPPVSLLGFS